MKEQTMETNQNQMTIVLSKEFNNELCDFYESNTIKNDFFMTRQQIGEALEYTTPSTSITIIHNRNSDRLDKFSTIINMKTEKRGTQKTFVYNLRGVMEICRLSRQPKADAFMDFVWDVMESLFTGTYKLVKKQTPSDMVALQSTVNDMKSQIFALSKQVEKETKYANERINKIADQAEDNTLSSKRNTSDCKAIKRFIPVPSSEVINKEFKELLASNKITTKKGKITWLNENIRKCADSFHIDHRLYYQIVYSMMDNSKIPELMNMFRSIQKREHKLINIKNMIDFEQSLDSYHEFSFEMALFEIVLSELHRANLVSTI